MAVDVLIGRGLVTGDLLIVLEAGGLIQTGVGVVGQTVGADRGGVRAHGVGRDLVAGKADERHAVVNAEGLGILLDRFCELRDGSLQRLHAAGAAALIEGPGVNHIVRILRGGAELLLVAHRIHIVEGVGDLGVGELIEIADLCRAVEPAVAQAGRVGVGVAAADGLTIRVDKAEAGAGAVAVVSGQHIPGAVIAQVGAVPGIKDRDPVVIAFPPCLRGEGVAVVLIDIRIQTVLQEQTRRDEIEAMELAVIHHEVVGLDVVIGRRAVHAEGDRVVAVAQHIAGGNGGLRLFIHIAAGGIDGIIVRAAVRREIILLAAGGCFDGPAAGRSRGRRIDVAHVLSRHGAGLVDDHDDVHGIHDRRRGLRVGHIFVAGGVGIERHVIGVTIRRERLIRIGAVLAGLGSDDGRRFGGLRQIVGFQDVKIAGVDCIAVDGAVGGADRVAVCRQNGRAGAVRDIQCAGPSRLVGGIVSTVRIIDRAAELRAAVVVP